MLQCISARHRIKLLSVASRIKDHNISLLKNLIQEGMAYTIDARGKSPADYLMRHNDTRVLNAIFDYMSEHEPWQGQEVYNYNILKFAFSKDK